MKLSLYKVTLNETGLVRRLRWNGGEFYRLSVRQVPALTRIRGVSSIAAAQRGWWWLESNNIHGMCLGTVPLKEQQRVLRRHEESLQPFPQCLLHDNELTSMMLSGTRVNSCQQHDLWQNPAPNCCCHGRDLHERLHGLCAPRAAFSSDYRPNRWKMLRPLHRPVCSAQRCCPRLSDGSKVQKQSFSKNAEHQQMFACQTTQQLFHCTRRTKPTCLAGGSTWNLRKTDFFCSWWKQIF